MKNNILRSALLYVLGTTITFVFYGLLGFVFNIIMGFLGAAKLDWLYRIFVFIFYIFVLNFTFYGSHKSKKRYVNTLPRDKCISYKEDFILFIKQEGIPVLFLYIVTISLQIFVFQFTKGYLQAFFVLPAALSVDFKNIWVGWAVCVLAFTIGYGGLSVFVRRKIKKMKIRKVQQNAGTNDRQRNKTDSLLSKRCGVIPMVSEFGSCKTSGQPGRTIYFKALT